MATLALALTQAAMVIAAMTVVVFVVFQAASLVYHRQWAAFAIFIGVTIASGFIVGAAHAQDASTPGQLSWIVPGDYDATVLVVDNVPYEVAFGAGCEGFAPPMDVLINAGSGGVASLYDANGNGQCNVLIGAPVE